MPHIAVIKASMNKKYLFHQYLNAGSSVNKDFSLLTHRYPIEYEDGDGNLIPDPGENGYNDYIQGRFENYLIPYLRDAYIL